MLTIKGRLTKSVIFYLGLLGLAAGSNALAETVEQCYEKGKEYYDQDNFKEAYTWFFKAAEQGYTKAQNWVGIMYEHGRGVEKDSVEAFRWYHKAAEQGDVHVQTILAQQYRWGKGVEQDYAEAVKWYRKAAEQGDASSQNNLGTMYKNGTGVERDYAEAEKWYRKAAEQGNECGYYNLAQMNELSLNYNMTYGQVVSSLRSDLTLRTVDSGYSRHAGGSYRIIYGIVQKPRHWSKGSFNWFDNKADFMEMIFVQGCNENSSNTTLYLEGCRMWMNLPTDSAWNAFSESIYRNYGEPTTTQTQLIWSYGPTTLLLDRHDDSVKKGYYLLQTWSGELTSIRVDQNRQKMAELNKSKWKK